MDQLTAHLDRGWDLAQRGDARGAEAAAKQALDLDPDAPEAHNLLGYAAALGGEAEDAIEHYKNALALDEGYFDAMLNAAEVMIHPLADWAAAIGMCDEALTWAETDEEVADALLLKIDALLGTDDDEGAKRALAMIPEGPFDNDRYDLQIGRAAFEVGELERAEMLIERAVARDQKSADAHYYRGLLREARGDQLAATSSFLRVRVLDSDSTDAPHTTTAVAFEEIGKAAIGKLDPALRRFVESAEIFVTPLPGLEVIADGVDPRAQLLLDGVATPERPGPPCARIFFYQRNVERNVPSADGVQDELVAALEHEIALTFLEDRRASEAAGRVRGKHELN